jgi:hypothetical protein
VGDSRGVRLQPDPRVASDPPFAIHVTRDAAERMRLRGGRLFLWQQPVGRMGSRDRLSLGSPPAGAQFTCHHYAKRDLQVCVSAGLEPREVIVRARRWPFSGIRVYVDGKRWGWRGDWPAM